jgi:hypothetical protein
MLSSGETYRDLGAHYFTTRDPERQTRRLVKQLERLGHAVTLAEGVSMRRGGRCAASVVAAGPHGILAAPVMLAHRAGDRPPRW